MKKNFIYALMSAIALTGAVSFSACSSSDEIVDNPNYDPETNTVKTEFVINVTQPGERTRQTPTDVGNDAFQGIDNMKLICFTATPAGKSFGTSDVIPLTSYTGPALSGDNTNNSSKVYSLYIPVDTRNFLFYATALSSTAGSEFAKGMLNNNLGSATAVSGSTGTTIQFALQPIVSAEETVTTPQDYLTTILNGIAGAKINGDGGKTWVSTSTATDKYQALGDAYKMFINQTSSSSGDVRQGSSTAVLHMVNDLFEAINNIYTINSDTEVKTLAKAVLDKIVSYFTVTTSGEGLATTYTWPSSGSYETGTDGATFNSNPYPKTQNLPDGSAVIKCEDGVFSYVNTGSMGTAAISTAYNNYTYPSQLTYYCNSSLWQTTAAKTSNNYPTSSADWATATNWTSNDWTESAVTGATRAVAMKDNITYGAAQLASTIKLYDGTSFTDNAAAVTSSVTPNQTFNNITLKIHGLLIGGQPDAAQYEYMPQGTGISKVIYDKISDDGTALTTTGVSNYTLVLDNFVSGDGATQSTVNIALEMTADKDFYGASGKIKAGQKFYLIGSLNPASPATGSTISWGNHTSFKSGDTGYGVNRVFIRDAKTEATFTLNANCLQKAYSTIPDLRSTQMIFGISVDLKWKAGLTFDVNLNGE